MMRLAMLIGCVFAGIACAQEMDLLGVAAAPAAAPATAAAARAPAPSGAALHPCTPEQEQHYRGMLRKPALDAARGERIWSGHVRTLVGRYAMKP